MSDLKGDLRPDFSAGMPCQTAIKNPGPLGGPGKRETVKGLWSSLEMTKWRGQDSNLRPRGYEPRELPDCSTPRHVFRHFNPGDVDVEGRFARFRPLALENSIERGLLFLILSFYLLWRL